MNRIRTALVLVALCGWVLPVGGEVIELKDGSKIEGKITSKTGTDITISTDGIEVRVSGDEVKTVDGLPYSCDYKALYELKCQETQAMDVEARFMLATWCKEHGLKEEMKTEIDRVLNLQPNHEGANRELGRLFVDGSWRTPEELKKLGYVRKGGEWMTPDEASAREGKVQYMGNWVRPEDVKRFEARQFSRYKDSECGLATHTVCDLNAQIRRLELVNMWKPTPEQLKAMWKVLNEAEADRLMFASKMSAKAPEIEAAWIALRNEAVRGVVDAYDQNPAVESRASSMEGIWKGVNKGAKFRLYGRYGEKFLSILTPPQKSDLMNKYCTSCHSNSYMKGGYGREFRGTQAGVDFLEKVRALADDEFNAKMCDLAGEALKKFGKGQQTLLGKKAQTAGKRSAQDMNAEEMTMADIMKRARLMTENEWARRKFNVAAEIEAKNQEERLELIKDTGKKEKGSYLIDGASQKMMADALFDGNLRLAVGMKLGMTQPQMAAAVKPSADGDVVPEFKDGKTAFQELCTMCHNTNRIDKAVKTPEYWRQTVTRRLGQGAIDDPKIIEMITDYLVNRNQQAQGK